MKTSLLRRMLWAQAAALTILLLLLMALNVIQVYRGRSWEFDSSLKISAGALAAFLEEETDPARLRQQAERIRLLDETYTEISDAKPGEYTPRYQVFDSGGRLLYRSASAPETPYTTQEPGFHRVDVGGARYWVLVQDGAKGRLRIQVAESIQLRRVLMLRGLKQYPLVFLVLFLPMAISTWLLSRRALKPLHQLAESVEARKGGDLSPLNPPMDLKETRPLVASLNRLLARVSELIETQQRFVADAAHELRTPLAVVSTQAHALMEEADVTQRNVIAGDLKRGIERATGLVRQLLAVARLEAVKPESVHGLVDLGTLARDRTSLILPLALAKSQDLGVEGPEHLICQGNGGVLGAALDNLMENAIRYTPNGGTITLRLGDGDSGPFLEVEDDGPGMSEAFKARAFERFTRELGSHTTGTGLGLAIVHRAVELHQGRVALASPSQGTGLRVRIELPASLPSVPT